MENGQEIDSKCVCLYQIIKYLIGNNHHKLYLLSRSLDIAHQSLVLGTLDG